MHANDVLEVWKFVNYISPELPDLRLDDTDLSDSLKSLQKEVHELKAIINKDA